jgi:hypothetical protein
LRAESSGSLESPEELGNLIADTLRLQGADEILAQLNG